MEIEEFVSKRPYLYHLTSAKNVENIIETGKLYSTSKIISMSNEAHNKELNNQKRDSSLVLIVKNKEYHIRDQKPISITVLSRCLTDGWKYTDFIGFLNKRVFFWPTINRLERHFNTYVAEKPIILRFNTQHLLELNSHAQFCRLNSGATRCNSHLGGNAPERGSKTFLSALEYNLGIGTVAEVTFPGECTLPKSFWKSNSPNGPWKVI